MSMTATQTRSRASRDVLSSWIERLEGLAQFHFQKKDLQKINVDMRVSNMSDFSPRFFTPFPLDNFVLIEYDPEDKASWPNFADSWFPEGSEPCLDLMAHANNLYNEIGHTLSFSSVAKGPGKCRMIRNGPGWEGGAPGFYNFHPVREYDIHTPNHWGITKLCHFHDLDPVYPHMKGAMTYAEKADNSTLLRGEMLCIMAIMRGRLRKIRLSNHSNLPVLLLSYIDTQVRILEGSMEDGQLVVRCSELVDLSCEENVPWDFLAKWSLSSPIPLPFPK